jgi:ferredoxin
MRNGRAALRAAVLGTGRLRSRRRRALVVIGAGIALWVLSPKCLNHKGADAKDTDQDNPRSKRRARYARVDTERCNGCGLCVSACPRKAIVVLDGVARIDLQRCEGRGECIDRCPLGVISLHTVSGGDGLMSKGEGETER